MTKLNVVIKMKKLCYFALSFGLALIIFCLLSLCIVALSVYKDLNSDGDSAKVKDTPSVIETPLSVTVILLDEAEFYAADLTIFAKQKKATAKAIDVSHVDSEKYFISQNIYSLKKEISAIGNQNAKFICVNKNLFSIIADRCRGLVYNISDDNVILLTGKQALELLDNKNFSNFCEQIAQHVLTYDFLENFQYISNSTNNNLSYPELYNAITLY